MFILVLCLFYDNTAIMRNYRRVSGALRRLFTGAHIALLDMRLELLDMRLELLDMRLKLLDACLKR